MSPSPSEEPVTKTRAILFLPLNQFTICGSRTTSSTDSFTDRLIQTANGRKHREKSVCHDAALECAERRKNQACSIPSCFWICSNGTPFVSGTMVFTQIS